MGTECCDSVNLQGYRLIGPIFPIELQNKILPYCIRIKSGYMSGSGSLIKIDLFNKPFFSLVTNTHVFKGEKDEEKGEKNREKNIINSISSIEIELSNRTESRIINLNDNREIFSYPVKKEDVTVIQLFPDKDKDNIPENFSVLQNLNMMRTERKKILKNIQFLVINFHNKVDFAVYLDIF